MTGEEKIALLREWVKCECAMFACEQARPLDGAALAKARKALTAVSERARVFENHDLLAVVVERAAQLQRRVEATGLAEPGTFDALAGLKG